MKDAKGHGSDARGGAMAPGARVNRTMGIRRSGVVVRPFPVDQSNDGTYRSSAMGNVPVQWDDGTKGYEHAQHLTAASALSEGAPPSKAGPSPVHPGAAGPQYSREAVNNAIASSNRAGRRIGGKEARAIHALLKGRH